VSILTMVTLQAFPCLLHIFAVITPIFYSMAAFCMLFAYIHHYAGRSDLLGIITCRRKRSASSILCAARFHAGVLWIAVLSFVLVQNE
jgi:hypothetical protein